MALGRIDNKRDVFNLVWVSSVLQSRTAVLIQIVYTSRNR